MLLACTKLCRQVKWTKRQSELMNDAVVRSYCQVIVKLLSSYCKVIVKLLSSYCQVMVIYTHSDNCVLCSHIQRSRRREDDTRFSDNNKVKTNSRDRHNEVN